jgi:hypothetical protein
MLENLSILTGSIENFRTVEFGAAKLIDSYAHQVASLDTLVSTLKSKCQDQDGALDIQRARDVFHNLSSCYPWDQQFKVLLQKGIYPYEYISCPAKLQETSLPPREVFHNSLTGEDLTEELYERARNVWRLFECETMEQYMRVYLEQDVLLLADVIENYCQMSMSNFNLDPLHFISGPALSFQAALRFTRANIQLITCPTAYNL